MLDNVGGAGQYYQQYNYNQNSGASAAASASGGGASAVAVAGPGGAAAAASAGGTSAVAVAGQPDQARLDPEARLQQAGDQFGQALQNLSPQEKADLRMLKQFVNKWADQMRQQGVNVDKASMFAYISMLYANQGLQQNPGNQGLQNLFGAGANFVNATNNAVQMDQQNQMGMIR